MPDLDEGGSRGLAALLRQGISPASPELLDDLATRHVESGIHLDLEAQTTSSLCTSESLYIVLCKYICVKCMYTAHVYACLRCTYTQIIYMP